jgi:hypothetical protein
LCPLEEPTLKLPAFLLAALPALICAGCEALMPTPDYGYLPPEEIVRHFAEWEGSVKSLEGEARVRIDSPSREGSLKATILVSKPHRFRMAAYPPVGGTVFDVSIVRDLMRFHLPSEDKVYERNLSPDSKAREGDISEIFAQSGLASIILGRSAPNYGSGMKMIDRDDGTVKFGVFDENGVKTEEIHVQEYSLFKLRHMTFGKGGQVLLDVTYGKYELRGEQKIWWPGLITIECPSRQFKLVMDFNEIDLNADIPPEAFEIEVPEGTAVIKD